jgi:hypothetical protein
MLIWPAGVARASVVLAAITISSSAAIFTHCLFMEILSSHLINQILLQP